MREAEDIETYNCVSMFFNRGRLGALLGDLRGKWVHLLPSWGS